MRVKLNRQISGSFGTFQAGAEVDLLEEHARPLVAGGYAEDLFAPPIVHEDVPGEQPKLETETVKTVPRKAVKR
jgi:hypothetical protein